MTFRVALGGWVTRNLDAPRDSRPVEATEDALGTFYMDIRLDIGGEAGSECFQTTEKSGGLDRTRICDLLRVKQAL